MKDELELGDQETPQWHAPQMTSYEAKGAEAGHNSNIDFSSDAVTSYS